METKKSNKKNKIETVADLMKPKKKYFYECYCVICKGKKVDSRTQETHTKNESFWKSVTSRENQKRAIEARKKKRSIASNVNTTETNLPKKRKIDSQIDSHQDSLNQHTSPSPDLSNNKDNLNALFTSKSKSSSHFHAPVPDIDGYCPNDNYCSEEDDDNYYFDDDTFEEDDDEDEDNIN